METVGPKVGSTLGLLLLLLLATAVTATVSPPRQLNTVGWLEQNGSVLCLSRISLLAAADIAVHVYVVFINWSIYRSIFLCSPGEHPDQRNSGDSVRLTATGCQLFTGELSIEEKDVSQSLVRRRRRTQASPWMRFDDDNDDVVVVFFPP